MLEALLYRIFGLKLKQRIEDSKADMILDLKHARIDWNTGEVRVPLRFDFPEEKK